MKHIFPALMIAVLLSACQPTLATRGNLVDPDDMTAITVGTSSREDVRAAIGTPTSTEPLNDNIWYYMGQKTERQGFRREKVTERRIVAVTFDEAGIVTAITPIENSGRTDVAMNERITPTSGRDLTFLQQVLGNLGRFNKEGDGDDRPVGAELPGQYN